MVTYRLAVVALVGLSLISCKKDQSSGARKPPPTIPTTASTDSTPADTSGTIATTPTTPALFTLTDQSRSLEEILENGKLTKDDCDKYFKGQTDRETTLRCGKWMFFYDNIGVPGIPVKLAEVMRQNAPNTVGKSFEHLGLFKDPFSKIELPAGMADGPDMKGGVKTYTLTCAACHFGKTTDGRFVVGQPNRELKFGPLTLAAATLPELALQKSKTLPPEVKKVLDPITDEIFGKAFTRTTIISQVIELIPSVLANGTKPLTDPQKIDLAVAPDGVLDPYSAPSLDDTVRVPLRISPLWGIDQAAMEAAGSKHGAMLGSGGGAPDLQHIMRTFKVIAGEIRNEPIMDTYKVEEVEPLIAYILSLAPPKNEKIFEATKLAAGEKLFERSCVSCHSGPGRAGTRIFEMAEVGTDPNVARMVDPDNSGKAVFDVLTPGELTGGIRARRLSGIFSRNLLLHNGSVDSLEDLFCLTGPRKDSGLGSGYSSAGHDFTCKGLTTEEKNSLIYYVQSL